MFIYIFSFEIFYLFLAEIGLRTTHALLRWKLGCSLVCLQMECQDWSAEYFVFWKGSIFKGFLNASSKTGRIGQRSSGKNGESTCFCIPLWGAIRLSFAVSVSAFKVWLVAIDFHVSIYKSQLMCILWICICLVYIYIYIVHVYYYTIHYIYSALLGKISECCPFLPFTRFGKHWQKGQKTSKRMTQIVPSMRWCYTWPQQNMPRGLSWGSHKDQLELLQKHLKQLSIIGFPKHISFLRST